MSFERSVGRIGVVWTAVGVLWTLLLVMSVVAAARGDYVMAITVPVAFAGLGLLLLWQRRTASRLYLQPLDTVLAHYRRTFRGPQADVMLALSSAQACACYGQFEQAEAFLAGVQWHGRGRLFEAWPLHIESLLLYWRDRAYRQGLAVARNAQDLGDVGGTMPGAATARLGYAAVVAAGEVFAGEVEPETVSTLESAAEKLPLPARLIAWWGLAGAAARAGDAERAAALLDRIRAHAPHCAPLLTLPS